MNTKCGLFDNVTQRIEIRFALLLAASLSHYVLIAAERVTPCNPDPRPYADSDSWQT